MNSQIIMPLYESVIVILLSVLVFLIFLAAIFFLFLCFQGREKIEIEKRREEVERDLLKLLDKKKDD